MKTGKIILFLLLPSLILCAGASQNDSSSQTNSPTEVLYDPEQLFSDFIDKAYALNSAEISIEEKLEGFSELLNIYVDTKSISRFVVGRGWRDLSNFQKSHFHKAFKEFLIVKLFSQIQNSLKDSTIKLLRVIEVKEQLRYLVVTKLNRSSGAPIQLEWDIARRKKEKSYKIANLDMEGINLLVNLRGEYSPIIEEKGIDQTIEQIKDLTKRIKEKILTEESDY